MNIVPLIHLKKGKIMVEREEYRLPFNEILEQVDKDVNIYVLDTDGIEKDKPNLCLYQKLSKSHVLWVDTGPRVLGDIVDVIMAGATNITVRRNLWHGLDVSSIKEITENKIYAGVGLKNQRDCNTEIFPFYDVDGLVVFDGENQVERDFKYGSFLKNLCIKHEVYAYERNSKNINYWDNLGATGLLVDISKIKEFKKNEF
ncbi:MAG: hypothetical protein KAR64_02675 [Thermoplasmatales archaeon]|nr:hypothetical protein [Thermoplasmatales archaeon]